MVGRSEALNLTMEAGMKLVPLTVKVKPWLPTCFDAGVILAMLGMGLVFVTENVLALEAPPSGAGLKTVTEKVPATTRSEAGI